MTPLGKAAPLDLAAVRERTRRWEEARERNELLHAERAFRAPLEAALGKALSAAGAKPGFLARLAFPGPAGAEAQDRLLGAKAGLEEAATAVASDARMAERYLARLEESWSGRSAEGVLRDRLRTQRGSLVERERRSLALLDRIASGLGLRAGGFGARLRLWGRQLAGRDPATAVAELQAELARWGAVRTPVLGAELTYVQGALRSTPLPREAISPAYSAGATGGIVLEDTTEGREVELSPEIRAKAQELGSAQAAYAFVKNGTRLEWYFGSLKGSTETLRSLRGNDVDLSALLVALLRAQGTPARYVRGTIALPVEGLAELMGLLEGAEAEAVHAGQPVAPELRAKVRERVLIALPALGVPFETVASGGAVAAVRFLHTWVEAYVPYASYRGAGSDASGKQWIALDPALTGAVKYAARTPAFDAYADAGLSAAALVRDYLAAPAPGSPLDLLRSRVEAHLGTARPGTGWAAALREVEQRAEVLPYLPGTLPFPVSAVHEEHAFLPDSAKHRLRLTASDPGGTLLLDVTVPLHQLVGRRTVFTYRPATPEDEQLVAAAGGLYQAPAGAVRLLPVLRVDGAERAVGTRSIGLGEQHDWTLEMLLPDGSSRRVANRVIAGNAVAIGLGAPGNAFVEGGNAASSAPDLDGPALRFLYGRAAAYSSRWTRDEEELAKLLRVVPLRPTANLVLVSNQLEVDAALGVRRGIVWKGLEVDADYRSMTPLELVPGRAKELLRLSGYQGSYLEARVLADGTGEESISAVQVIQQARAQGVPVLELTASNAAAELPGLQAPPDVLRDVADQLAQGREVVVPLAPIAIRDWTGTGFVARDPQTEEGGYFLSGHVSGGQTVVSPSSWADAALTQMLQRPDRPASTRDVSRVARIAKVPLTDFQRGEVGKALPRPLTVYVTTIEGIPVEGASVTFARDVSNATLGASGLDRLTVQTDASGRAAVQAFPDTRIGRGSWAILKAGSPNPQYIGYDTVAVSTSDGVNTIVPPAPFEFVAEPGPPAKVIPPCDRWYCTTPEGPAVAPSNEQQAYGIEFTVSLSVTVADRYDNALANQPVLWKQAPATGAFIAGAQDPNGVVHVLDPRDPQQHPALAQVSGTDGTVSTRFIPGVSSALSTRFEMRASVPLTTGEIGADFVFVAQRPWPDEYFLRIIVPASAHPGRDGVYGAEFPSFVGAQVFHWEGNTQARTAWAAVPSSVSMAVLDERNAAAPVLLHEEAVQSTRTEPRAPTGFDGETVSVFVPRHEVDGGAQRWRFRAEVAGADGRAIAAKGTWDIVGSSLRPEVVKERVLPGGIVRANAFGFAESTDDAMAFVISNPASYPIYGRIVQEPLTAGEVLVNVPDPGAREPGREAYYAVPPYSRLRLQLGIASATHGGTVRLELYTPTPEGPTIVDPAGLSQISYATTTMRLAPPGMSVLAGGDLKPGLILPVRSPEYGDPARLPGPDDLEREAPMEFPARLLFQVKGSGDVYVRRGAQVIAAARVVTDGQGAVQSATPIGPSPVPTVTMEALAVVVGPGPSLLDEVLIEHQALDGTRATTVIPVRTSVVDMGAQPVGHTFVKNVSVVDGHLARQWEDLAVPGRGGGLRLARSYTSRGAGGGPLGSGWTHSYRSYVIQGASQGRTRYAVVGGEGTGQVFTCGAGPCKPQRGYHGTLTATAMEVRYRAKNGTVYRYEPAPVEQGDVARFRLASITDAAGNATTLRYGDGTIGGELLRVYEPGNGRFLHFKYTPRAGRNRRLESVELRLNPGGALDPAVVGEPGGVCVSYGQDARLNLNLVARRDGGCDGPVARGESFAYQESPNEALQDNIVSYTDPDGSIVKYRWYTQGDRVPGEAGFVLMGDKEERVRAVVEAPEPGREVVTSFEYSLSLEPMVSGGSGYATRVTGPRPGIPATVYRQNPYGATSQVERPVAPGEVAISSTSWDPVHLRPVTEVDPRGRRTSLAYDGFGNLVERRTSTPVLAAAGAAPASEPLTDGDGNPVAEVVERWAYDPAFAAEVCHVDAEGRVRITTLDSDGADPRSGAPSGTGLALEVRNLAATVEAGRIGAAGACLALAPTSRSASDVVVTRTWCRVAGGACPAGAVAGDLVSTAQGRHVERVEQYDRAGNVLRSSRPVSTAASVTTTSTYDGRSRRLTQHDTQGHSTEWRHDALDHVTHLARANGKGGSPGDVRTFAYLPGGQLHVETNGLGLTRTFTLDGMGRVSRIDESGGGLAAALRTEIAYDEAGNKVDVTDRRGVLTHTEYDWGDRPTRATVRVADAARWAAQGGDTTDTTTHAVATYGHDLAGNRVFETDRHGFRTDHALDPLYRVVRTTLPPVPGAIPADGRVRHALVRRFDRAGNRTYEADGNGHATLRAYDGQARLVRTTDPLGRVETRAWDPEGTLREIAIWAPGSGTGGTPLHRTTTTYDALGRPLTVSEELADLDGARVSYALEASAYDDDAHEVRHRDRRGFVTTRRLDDLDRIYEEVADDASAAPARQPDASVGSALALRTAFGYDANGNRTRVIDALGRVTTETYDGLNRLRRRDLPMGVFEAFVTNGEGQVVESTDRREVVRRTLLDALGRSVRESLVERLHGNAELALVRRTYQDAPDGDRVSVVETDARGNATTRYRDALDREVRVVDALGLNADTYHDAVSARFRMDRNGNVTTWSYDAANRVLDQSDSGGGVTLQQTTRYDDGQLTVTETDRSGIETVKELDGLGRTRRITRTGNRVEPSTGARLVQQSESRYDGAGNLVRSLDPNGDATAWVYDGAGRKVSETRGAGTAAASTWSYRFDVAGNRTETKSPRGAWAFDVREAYDDLDRAVRSEDALGNVTSRAFDGAGNKVCERRPLGGDPLGASGAAGLSGAAVEAAVCGGPMVTRYEYDELSKLARVLDAAGGENTFVYDEARDLVAKQDANGNVTTYGYDALHRRTGEHQHLDAHARLSAWSRTVPSDRGAPDPVAGTGVLQWAFTYDGNGNLETMTDPRTGSGAAQETVRHAYGVLDRLAGTTWKSFPTPRELPSLTSVAYLYTGNGQLRVATEQKETATGPVDEVTTRGYDGLERQETETRYDGKVLTFGYDAKGNRTLVRDPDGVETTYAYDAQDRLTTATTPAGATSYAYWPDGLARRTTHPSGVQEGRCYDAAARLAQLVTARGAVADDCTTTGQLLTSYGYGYDADGNRLAQTERRTDPATQNLGSAEETAYGYDALDRLVAVKYPDATATLYRLDPVGNRIGERKVPASRVAALTVDAFAAVQPGDALADVAGTFNRADWLLSRSDAVDATRSVSFGYDLNGNQTARTRAGTTRELRWDARNTLTVVYEGGVERGRYDYDRNLQRVKRRTASENVEYVLDDRHVLQEASGAQAGHPSTRRYHYGSGPLLVEDGGTRRFISTDALGSTTDLTTAAGTVASMRKYDAWGQHRNDTAPPANEPKLGFTGHQYDPETGLVYARARYYDPEMGRFLSRDSYEGSLSDAPSLHRFAYAWMNPLRYWDRTGFCTEGQDEGCTLSLWDTLAAAAEAATSDTTYADATAARREQNSQAAAAKNQEEQVQEDENGPSTWKRIKSALGKAAATVGQAWDESRVGQKVNELDDAGRKWSREKGEHSLDGLPGGLNRAEAQQLDQVEGGSAPEQYADRQQLAGDLSEKGYVAVRDAAVTKGVAVGAGVRISRGKGALTRAEAKALAAEEKATARAAAASEKTYITYVLKNESGEVVYVGRASGKGTAEEVLRQRLAKGHDVYGATPGLKAEVAAVQGNAEANKGAEGVLYEYHKRDGAKLRNDPMSPPMSDKPEKLEKVRSRIDEYSKDLNEP